MNVTESFSGMNIHQNVGTNRNDDEENSNASSDNDDEENSNSSSDNDYGPNTTFDEYYAGSLIVPVTIRATHNLMVFGFMEELLNKGWEGGYWQRADMLLKEKLQQCEDEKYMGVDEDEREYSDDIIVCLKRYIKQNEKYMDFYWQHENYVLRFIGNYADNNSIGQEDEAQTIFSHYYGGDDFDDQDEDFMYFGIEIKDYQYEDTMA